MSVTGPSNAPPHRHAAPCGPWPWQDLDDEVEHPFSQSAAQAHKCPHPEGQCVGCWNLYPQSLFPNWTPEQVEKSGVKSILPASDQCKIYRVEVLDGGTFVDAGVQDATGDEEFWKVLQSGKRTQNVRLRVLLVENLSLSVMQMLGTRYNVEPFLWTSSVNRIPSRYQEDSRPEQGDHITITLTFPRAMEETATFSEDVEIDDRINTQDPLRLRAIRGSKSDQVITLDHLAIHTIRDVHTSTIISYLSSPRANSMLAGPLHSRVYLAGQSVYWNKIFSKSSDPSFVLLTLLWYALYAWDQAFEVISAYISDMEAVITDTTRITHNTQELHKIRAHLLHYTFLLEDFRKSINFIQDTPNPAMNSALHASERETSTHSLETECMHLLIQIDRITKTRSMWDTRLQNLMQLAYSLVNIEDSHKMKTLSEVSMRDSTAMRQVAYLTMFFLPASFMTSVFGMNIVELVPQTTGTLGHYFAFALPLTFTTAWLVVSMHGNWTISDKEGNERGAGMWERVLWPLIYIRRWIAGMKEMHQRRMLKAAKETV